MKEQTKTFIKEHKKQILIGAGIAALTVVGGIIGLKVKNKYTLVERTYLHTPMHWISQEDCDFLVEKIGVNLSDKYYYVTKEQAGKFVELIKGKKYQVDILSEDLAMMLIER